ncbi:hypothetical protein PhCBS80983_g02211 [Powellomyces hirtus]|uniref:t-SNARE coiled-coil homology domain-containing protein n=1 Tax=Powellomyces hirtus TaxID=109895 RepID=A0A507E8V7_9FUNG|nr:hypothetical protein PhCBS80983_g02211 [Powellomyces hirtus]
MVSVDRLASLQSKPQATANDMEMGSVHTLNSSSLDQFLHQAETIQRAISRISRNTGEIRTLHQKALFETSAQSVSMQQVDRLTDDTSDLIQDTRQQIKSLSSIPVSSSTDAQVHSTQQKSLASKLMTAAREFQAVQQDAQQAYRGQMARQYQIAHPGATPAQIDNAVENTNGQIFQQELLASRVGEQRHALHAVQTRHEELVKIERSIGELFTLFQDMQALLDTQQVQIDTIEQHVETTDVHVQQGSQQMTKAIRSAKSSRKLKWILTCIVAVILIILLVVLLLKLGVFESKGNDTAAQPTPPPLPPAPTPAPSPLAKR